MSDTMRAALIELQKTYEDNADQLSTEEKKKHIDFLRNIADMARAMESDSRIPVNETEYDTMVLKMRGNFPLDATGSVMIPTKEVIAAALNKPMYSRANRMQYVPSISIESVSKEKNFNYILQGPNSPNYLTKEVEVYVKIGNCDQTKFLLENFSEEKGASINVRWVRGLDQREFSTSCTFSNPRRDTRTRAAYREIGTLITHLRQVDAQLKAIGAVAGRGGIPVLSDNLVQKEDFDSAVKIMKERPIDEAGGFTLQNQKEILHSYLCSKTRVDKRKRQETLEPLVDERIDILLKLSQFDPDEFPFVVECDFK